MLQEETLKRTEQRQYEEPDGELVEVMDRGNNTITVLTRVDSDKGVARVDPSEYSVADLKDELDGTIADPALIEAIIDAEKKGKNRKTALDYLNDIKP